MVIKIFGLYEQFPRRYGKSKKIVYSKKEFLSLVNRDNGYNDVFVSVFSYTVLKEGTNGNYKIDSESAIIDKLYIDMDTKDFVDYKNFYEQYPDFKNIKEIEIEKLKEKKDKVETYTKENWSTAEQLLYKKAYKLELILRKDVILHVYVYSGGGFHLYIYIENRPENKKYFCTNAIDYINKLVCNNKEYYIDIDGKEKKRQIWDPHSPLKLSQMARVIGTYNPKRKLFCTSLDEYDLDMGIEWIKAKAKTQHNKIHYLGKRLMYFDNSYDQSNVLEKCSEILELNLKDYSSNIKELLESLGILWEEIPLCMKYFLKENQELDYNERYLIITFLYRCGLSKKEIIEVLKLILTPKKLYHCTGVILGNYRPSSLQKSRIEYQTDDIIENDYYISCSQVKNYGMCNVLCKIKDVLYYFS